MTSRWPLGQAKLKANIDAPGKVTELSRIRTTLQEHRTALRNDLTQVRDIRTEMTERAHQQKRVMGESRPHTSPVETTSHERQPHCTPAYCSHKRKRRSTSYSPAKRPLTKAVKGRKTVPSITGHVRTEYPSLAMTPTRSLDLILQPENTAFFRTGQIQQKKRCALRMTRSQT